MFGLFKSAPFVEHGVLGFGAAGCWNFAAAC